MTTPHPQPPGAAQPSPTQFTPSAKDRDPSASSPSKEGCDALFAIYEWLMVGQPSTFTMRQGARIIDRHFAPLLELHQMQMAGIMTASFQNTPSTVKDRLDPSSPYWTQAYADVCAAVDREMALLARVEAAEKERDKNSEVIAATRAMSIDAFRRVRALIGITDADPLPFEGYLQNHLANSRAQLTAAQRELADARKDRDPSASKSTPLSDFMFQKWVSDDDNDGTYRLKLNEDNTREFFANLEQRERELLARVEAAEKVAAALRKALGDIEETMVAARSVRLINTGEEYCLNAVSRALHAMKDSQ